MWLSLIHIFTEALEFVNDLKLTDREMFIAASILKEIKERLGFLKSVGLEYLTLSRSSGTLSGGESQRIRLATQIGSSLMGVLYILDEPSIGLHQSCLLYTSLGKFLLKIYPDVVRHHWYQL